MATAELSYGKSYEEGEVENFIQFDLDCEVKSRVVLDRISFLMRSHRYITQKTLLECWGELRTKYSKEVNLLKKQLQEIKAKTPSLGKANEVREQIKAIKKRIAALTREIAIIDKNKENIRRFMSYSPEQIKGIFRKMLELLSFSCTKSYDAGRVYIEKYHCTLSDQELHARAVQLCGLLEAKVNQEVQQIKETFPIQYAATLEGTELDKQ